MTAPLCHALARHPATPGRWVRAAGARVGALPDGSLAVGFVVAGDLARLRIPLPAPPLRADRLWEHTCFEAFVAPEESDAYREFNFSPSGQWAAYAFRRYRERAPFAPDAAPDITVRRGGERLELDAVLPAALLPELRGNLRLGLSAVIEDEEGAVSYWALAHAPGRPDFHHPDAFAITIELPRRATGDARRTQQ